MCNLHYLHSPPYIKWFSLQTKQKQPTTKQSQTPLAFQNCLALRHRLLCIRDGNTTPQWRWGLRIAVQSHYAILLASSHQVPGLIKVIELWQTACIALNGFRGVSKQSCSKTLVFWLFAHKLKLKKGDIFLSLRQAVMCQEHYHSSISLIKPRKRVQILAAYSVKLTSL